MKVSKTSILKYSILYAACIIASCATYYNANANLKVCNDTQNNAGIAIGYKEKQKWISQGWWHIPADECADVVEGNLEFRYYYLFAEDANTRETWKGEVDMCTSNVEFKIEGTKDCYARGYEKEGFFEVDTKQQKYWQVRLKEQNKNNN